MVDPSFQGKHFCLAFLKRVVGRFGEDSSNSSLKTNLIKHFEPYLPSIGCDLEDLEVFSG